MGYYSTLAGRIDITPPLKWSEYKDSPLRGKGDNLLVLVESTETVNHDHGVTELRQAVAVEPLPDDQVKASELENELAQLAQLAPGRTFSGVIIRSGEEPGDVERYRINGHDVVSETARLVWPDGQTVDPAEL